LYNNFSPHLLYKLNSIGDERIQDIDEGRVSLQVISHGPGEAALSVCTATNDDLAAAISKNPTRLAGFAVITMSQPTAAARELTRCVKDLGFTDAPVENHVDGQFYDNERFWPVFKTAQELDVPIYIYPCFPAENNYKGNCEDSVAVALSAYGWSWHSETSLHILRLFASGLFDRFPRLKFVEEIEKSGLIVGEDLEKFAFKNAEKLLGVKAGAS
jgi:predicted TIM-barrel fold metal-dependent hydrolase